MKIKNVIGHFNTVNKHRWKVFMLSIKAGIPLRGLLHDLSKYSFIEFIESAKYYQGGKRSPIVKARSDKGYSKAWLHHKGRNRHHFEYWVDTKLKEQPVIPFKYSAEMICDMLAAGMIYQGKNWHQRYPLEYWEREEKEIVANEKMKKFCRDVFTEVANQGIEKTINKKNLKAIYDKYCKS